jgi:hypothetical protein
MKTEEFEVDWLNIVLVVERERERGVWDACFLVDGKKIRWNETRGERDSPFYIPFF